MLYEEPRGETVKYRPAKTPKFTAALSKRGQERLTLTKSELVCFKTKRAEISFDCAWSLSTLTFFKLFFF